MGNRTGNGLGVHIHQFINICERVTDQRDKELLGKYLRHSSQTFQFKIIIGISIGIIINNSYDEDHKTPGG
jgi:hypothetical protein